MARFLVAALALSLLIFAGGASAADPADAAATPRNIPWDCSDWQAAAAVADAADERVSVILESLAANRGKTLYCAVDQSDTFTKSETWLAGKDRNERDDTVYYGATGRFRGFLAAQEGYLTDGESGVTGISRARIFEFPEEPRKKRRKKPKRNFDLCPGDLNGDPNSRIPPYPLCVVQTGLHGTPGAVSSVESTAQANAQNQWDLVLSGPLGRPADVDTNAKFNDWILVANRQADANRAAAAGCRARRARLVGEASILNTGGTTAVESFYYSRDLDNGDDYQFTVGRQIYFTATCRG